ncbi:hypothetical protein RJT34_12715 [Clitoria ternatea]|uniref:Uncharacterized protein n=1 Tax=Clitoria ternatea TaxID=43366 RepID=A0AAN9JQT6_CLITE
MAPSGRTATTTSTRTTSKTNPTTTTGTRQQRRKTNLNKKNQQHTRRSKKVHEMPLVPTVLPSSCSSISSQDSSKEVNMDTSEVVIDDVPKSSSACSTPKGQKFRIPEISTCPPAPKKQRVLSNCSLRRTQLSFFAPPDLELFFFMALRDVSV